MAALFVCAAPNALAEIQLPQLNPGDPIAIRADAAQHWMQGTAEIWILNGRCEIRQGQAVAQSRDAVVWIYRKESHERQPHGVLAYLEGAVNVDLPPAPGDKTGRTQLTDQRWVGRFQTRSSVDVRVENVTGEPNPLPSILERALAARNPEPMGPVLQTQYIPPTPAGQPAADATATRRLRAFARGDAPLKFEWIPDPSKSQWVAVIDGGVNVLVDGLANYGTLDLSSDRVVIWTAGLSEPDLSGQSRQSEDTPLEFYLEGNIVFRQGARTIHAERMYYNVRTHVGTILHAELLTPVKKYDGLIRLKSEMIQQLGQDRFHAKDSFFTSSRMGEPGYRVQVSDLYFEDIQEPIVDPLTGAPQIDPKTQEPAVEHHRTANGQNGLLFFEQLPIFYWPSFSTDLETSNFYIRQAQFRQDSVFGTQVLTDWDLFQILGFRKKPENTEWLLSADYMSLRGVGAGTTFRYNRPDLFGIPGRTTGLLDYWGIQDHGQDNLGPFRNPDPPAVPYRYRGFWQHRQQLPDHMQLTGEVGFISDRNFLEEYFRQEWTNLKDMATGVELKQLRDNSMWSVTGDVHVNPFFTETQWLPRADHYWIGQSLLGDRLTWFEHSNVGYAQFQRTNVPPTNSPDYSQFAYLPWESSNASGLRAATRQEIDWPFQLGPVRTVPYALGELGYWGQDLNGQEFQRAYGQFGLRATMPMWSVDPTVESNLWNVHGIAHKVVFEVDAYYAAANRHFQDGNNAVLPLYDALDDNAIEAGRRRWSYFDFGSPLPFNPGVTTPNFPMQFYEPLYALRSGVASWVSSPTTEIADDLFAVRLGANQRWQTKRGPADNRRITDWIVFNTNVTLFPDTDRDNFGRFVGLLDYDARWFVGDRLTLMSDGIFDFFDSPYGGGQKIVNVGGFLSRPPRGSLYAGFTLLEGPVQSHVLNVAYSYWMSPKWVSSLGCSVDLGKNGNIGQNLILTRVGESFLVSVGVTVDAIRQNVGANFAVEPRFLPKGRLGSVGGARIPSAGASGLE